MERRFLGFPSTLIEDSKLWLLPLLDSLTTQIAWATVEDTDMVREGKESKFSMINLSADGIILLCLLTHVFIGGQETCSGWRQGPVAFIAKCFLWWTWWAVELIWLSQQHHAYFSSFSHCNVEACYIVVYRTNPILHDSFKFVSELSYIITPPAVSITIFVSHRVEFTCQR
jgi:hypothetical protein